MCRQKLEYREMADHFERHHRSKQPKRLMAELDERIRAELASQNGAVRAKKGGVRPLIFRHGATIKKIPDKAPLAQESVPLAHGQGHLFSTHLGMRFLTALQLSAIARC